MSAEQALILKPEATTNHLALPKPTLTLDRLLEKNLLPDWLIRIGNRRLLRERLHEENRGSAKTQQAYLLKLIDELKQSPIAVDTQAANEQHYEVPTRFYQLCLGARLKYSGALWPDCVTTLDAAEETMLELTCKRAQLADGQNILELGCGWGSLSLWMAEHFSNAQITGVSNSATQKIYIDAEAQKREGASVKNDVSVPVSRVPELLARAEIDGQKLIPGMRMVPFGHMGDGNIHLNFEQPVDMKAADFLARDHDIMDMVGAIVWDLEGSFSAEHGVGRLKPYMMPSWRGGAELATMQRIKQALDPLGLMNPGKVLP